MNNTVKSVNSKLGHLGMQLLAYTQLRKKRFLYSGEISKAFDISAKQENNLLGRLKKNGLLIRLKRGVYLAPERMPPGGRWSVSEYFILAAVMEAYKGAYQISGPNAFNFYGFEEQIPSRVYVYNDRIYGEKNIGGREFLFIKTGAGRLGAAIEITTSEGSTIRMASRARALVDAIYDWSRYDTIPRAYTWIMENCSRDPAFLNELISVTARFGNKATVRRIGFLLYAGGFTTSDLSKLKRLLRGSKSLIPWVPGESAKGIVNKEWGIIVNGTIPS
jgi:predicted transcriptional regulator of viral defense system